MASELCTSAMQAQNELEKAGLSFKSNLPATLNYTLYGNLENL